MLSAIAEENNLTGTAKQEFRRYYKNYKIAMPRWFSKTTHSDSLQVTRMKNIRVFCKKNPMYNVTLDEDMSTLNCDVENRLFIYF